MESVMKVLRQLMQENADLSQKLEDVQHQNQMLNTNMHAMYEAMQKLEVVSVVCLVGGG
jgi:hypothetical protein